MVLHATLRATADRLHQVDTTIRHAHALLEAAHVRLERAGRRIESRSHLEPPNRPAAEPVGCPPRGEWEAQAPSTTRLR